MCLQGSETEQLFAGVVAKCSTELAKDSSSQNSLADEYSLTCVGGVEEANDCLPPCDEQQHGKKLLANINGEDSSYTCELHHGLCVLFLTLTMRFCCCCCCCCGGGGCCYCGGCCCCCSYLVHTELCSPLRPPHRYSWLGGGTGGIFTRDTKAFISAIISGAAGFFGEFVDENDAGVVVDLTIQPNQVVSITGDAAVQDDGGAPTPRWGSGGFTVRPGAALSLSNLAVEGEIYSAANATVRLSGVVWRGHALTMSPSSSDGGYGSLQCFAPYTTLRDSWRSTGTGGGDHGDCSSGTGVGGGRWYRFAGAGGDALPLTDPGYYHCGTTHPGWLSGWATPQGGGDPPESYSGAGRYPAAAEGVVESTVCFDDSRPCANHVQVGVVRCGGFLLWRLPDAPFCIYGYCTAASGL